MVKNNGNMNQLLGRIFCRLLVERTASKSKAWIDLDFSSPLEDFDDVLNDSSNGVLK